MVKNELFITDCHFPDTDPKAWNLTLQIIQLIKPELVWLGGDFVDFKAVSRFPSAPEQRLTLKKDLAAARKALAQLRNAAPNSQIVFRLGNHERRLQAYLCSRAPELANLDELSLPGLLKLKDIDCTFRGGDDRTKIGHLFHIHGDEVATGNVFPARSALSRIHDNVIFGHVHRFSVAYETGLGGTNHVAWSIGCLQNLQVDYSFHTSWVQGIAKIDYAPSGLFQITPLPFFKDKGRTHCFVNGKLLSA